MAQPNVRYTQRHYTVRFLAPAFLGNAVQDAQWRTPPFKALLRQWWRVAWMAENGHPKDITRMRREEGLLFGHAWLEDDRTDVPNEASEPVRARKSLVRLRLDTESASDQTAWRHGSQEGVAPLATSIENGYAWFGLVRRGKNIPDRNAIRSRAEESVRILKIAAPDTYIHRLDTVMELAHQFGTLGSRSRGGWGSVAIKDNGEATAPSVPDGILLDWQRCLKSDWARAIARCEQGPWIWESTKSFESWDKAMAAMAQERRNARLKLKQPAADLRKALGFAGAGRMASPLRWKLMADPDGKLRIRVFAMPHKIPTDSGETLELNKLEQAWRDVASHLDSARTFRRLSGVQ
ncbi:hypothetical protein [Thioalkalivibrio sp. ALE11]|uniref:hypothetical protein n=1 Tax=Thioalkalivibrio sp. ALE11 TaxID=1265494 RepID=UPI00036C3111|nr:hypothetical protein [Thioalkalivibrio sp. ALE11]